jgi:putative alpha-1,2-mannosidase
MSAWYLFSALGFYPVNPVSGEYVVGSYVSGRRCVMCAPRRPLTRSIQPVLR